MICPIYLKYTDKQAWNCFLKIKALKHKLALQRKHHDKCLPTKKQLAYEQFKFKCLLKKKVRWTDEMIVQWHKETFPKATLDSQLRKLKEEILEAYNAFDDITELADVYIVCVTLHHRYKCPAGDEPLNNFKKSKLKKQILDAVDKKMYINIRRRYRYINGVYHH